MQRILPVIALVLCAGSARAARPVVTWGHMKSSRALVLGTLHEVKPVSRTMKVGSEEVTRKGFSFTVRITEVLRGRIMEKEFSVPFSAAGYATNWEFGAAPKDGRNVLVTLKGKEDGHWQPLEWPNGIWNLESFDSHPVPFVRQLVKLWSLTDSAEVKRQIIEGRFDPDPHFRSYSLSVLQSRSGTYTGVDISGSVTESEALALVWDTFRSPKCPLNSVLQCDNILWNRLRGENWYGHAPRADVLLKALRRAVSNASIATSTHLDGVARGLTTFPGRRDEVLAALTELLQSDVRLVRNRAALRLGSFYEPLATDESVAKTNRRIWQLLEEFLRSEDRTVAISAAHSASIIAMNVGMLEPLSGDIQKLFETASTLPHRETISRFGAAERAVKWTERSRTLVAEARADGARLLTIPWSSQIGQKVVAAGETGWRDGRFGATFQMDGKRLWVDGLEAWPDSTGGGQPVIVTGRLAVRNDLKAFRVKPGEPFGEGLPVPEGFEVEESRRRFVVEDAEWWIFKNSR